VIGDNVPYHIARMVTGHAEGLGIEQVFLPGYSSDLSTIEGLWDWRCDEGTRGYRQVGLKALRAACQDFVEGISTDAKAMADRLWPRFVLGPAYEARLLVST
jgi:transposase